VIRFAVLCVIFVTGLFCRAQDLSGSRSQLQNHPLETDITSQRAARSALPCRYVSIDSDDEAFPSEQLRQSVGLEPGFARQGFALSTNLQSADVKVHLGIITGVVQDRTVLLQAWDTRSHTTTQENFPWPRSDHEHAIATRLIVMLSKLCGERPTAKLQKELSHEQVAERLGSFHRIQAISRTYLAPKRMVIELSAREEIADWGITISTSPQTADVALLIDHLPSISWEYRLVDLRDGAQLDSGSVFAFQEERAASRIADTLIIHLAEYRSLKPLRTTRSNSGVQGHSSDQFGTWRVTEILESLENPEPVSRGITLGLQRGNLIGSTSDGQLAFSIDTHGIVDMTFDDSAYYRLAPDPILNEYPNLLYYIKIPKHRIHIGWNVGNDTRLVSLEASKGKLKELFARLAGVVNSQGVVSDIR
jgi:hypothetical protein